MPERARTGAEWFDRWKSIIERICSDIGVSPPRWDRRELVTSTGVAASQVAAEIDSLREQQFDALDPDSATGEYLLLLARLARVQVSKGTASRATLTLTAWSNGSVPVSKGKRYKGNGKIWALDDNVIVPASGTATVLAVCTELGSFEAPIGSINAPLDITTGITAVTNAAAATVGTFGDTEEQIRARIRRGANTGSRSQASIESALEDLPDIERARIVYNTTNTTVTVSGVSIPRNGTAIFVYPPNLTSDAQAAALQTIFRKRSGVGQLVVPADVDISNGLGFRGSAAARNDQLFTVGAWYIRRRGVRVRVTIRTSSAPYGLYTGTRIADVSEAISKVLTDYINASEPGGTLENDAMRGANAAITGVRRTTVECALETSAGSGTYGSYSSDDVEVGWGEFACLDGSIAFVEA